MATIGLVKAHRMLRQGERVTPYQQTQNICMTFIQRRPNIFDIGPTLYKCYTNAHWAST